MVGRTEPERKIVKPKQDPKTAALIQCVYAIKVILKKDWDLTSQTRLEHVDYERLGKAYRVGQKALGKESTIPE